VTWQAELRNGSHYIRQILNVLPLNEAARINRVELLSIGQPGFKPAGRVAGVPAVRGNVFIGYELPHAKVRTKGGMAFYADVNTTYEAGKPLVQSCVMGVSAPTQMRRSFLSYIERERAHPYHQFLHYQSWYDLHTPDHAANGAECVDTIKGWNREFIKPYKIQFDSFVLDDGWDDLEDCWAVSKQLFPEGFAPLSQEAGKTGTGLGLWFSPSGGYLTRGRLRKKYNRYSYHLSEENYFNRFKEMTSKYMREHDVNYFKFDKLGNWADTAGAFRMARELREVNPKVFINITAGTWPSPFFLMTADSTWRGGADMGYAGKGSRTQQWITFRDRGAYGVYQRSPLYPQNSLMTHGLVYGLRFRGAFINESLKDFRDQARSYFGHGANLQELYISYRRMLPEHWAILAEAAQWAKSNEDVMVDTHWINGECGPVYGWAAWNGRKGVITLRNSEDKPMSYQLDVRTAFELPRGAPQTYALSSPWEEDKGRPAITATAGTPITVNLESFEVLNLDAIPE
jgi:hypothetical protein